MNKDPHNQIEYRLLILLFGAIMLTGGKSLWVNIVGGVFVAYGVLRILYKDVYKAMRSA